MKKLVIAGGSGFLGQTLTSHFVKLGYHVVILSRKHQLDTPGIRYEKWDGKSVGPWVQQLEGATALVNLTGKSVDCRYTEANKQQIYDSRLDATAVLGKAIQGLSNPPDVWINASSATIYRHAEDRDMAEVNGEFGEGFSVDVCQKWERTFIEVTAPATRKVSLRIAIVLGKHGGALEPLRNLARIGMGGKQGSGRQYFSWLHELDFNRMIAYIILNKHLEGIYNASSPHPLKNQAIMRKLRQAMAIPLGLPMPVWLLEIGARLIGTETELILKSRRVVPGRLLDAGFVFTYPEIEGALEEIVSR